MSMRIIEDERRAIVAVVEAGARFGFGNMIAHLQTAWARTLMKQWSMTEKDARHQAGGIGYPFQMQDDLMQHGEWDETGERYR